MQAVTIPPINPMLLRMVDLHLGAMQKSAIVPGMPPPDPNAAAGGAPPGAPPGDPASMGMPPADPMAAAGGAPPAGGAPAGEIDPAMMQAAQQATQQQMAANPMGAGGEKPKTKKVDPEIINARLYSIERMLAKLMQNAGLKLDPTEAMTPGVPEADSLAMASQGGADGTGAGASTLAGGPQAPPMPGVADAAALGKAASNGRRAPGASQAELLAARINGLRAGR